MWIVLSLCWAGAVGWFAYEQESARATQYAANVSCMEQKKLEGANPFECFVGNPFDDLPRTTDWLITHYATWALLPPLGLLALGLMVLWVFAGFKRS
jgi:hypothetical protein